MAPVTLADFVSTSRGAQKSEAIFGSVQLRRAVEPFKHKRDLLPQCDAKWSPSNHRTRQIYTNTSAFLLYACFSNGNTMKRGSEEGGSQKRGTRGMEELKQEECMCLGDVSL